MVQNNFRNWKVRNEHIQMILELINKEYAKERSSICIIEKRSFCLLVHAVSLRLKYYHSNAGMESQLNHWSKVVALILLWAKGKTHGSPVSKFMVLSLYHTAFCIWKGLPIMAQWFRWFWSAWRKVMAEKWE